MKSSIRTQIMTAFIAILTLTMVLCIGLNNGLLKDFYYQKKQEKVVHYYEKLDQLTNNKSENDSKVSAVLISMRDADNISFIQTTSDWTLDEVSANCVKLGSTLTVGTCLTPSIILDLQKKIPDLDVYSFVTNTQNIEQKLLRSELDAAVVEGEIHSPDLVVLPIIDDCLVLAAGKKHPFYRRGRIHDQELNNQKFAVREYGSGTRQLFEDYTLRHDLKIRTAWEANSPQALLNAVLYNQMLSVMSIRLMHHEIRHRSVRVFCNEAGEWNRKFKLVYHKNKFLTPAIFELEKILHTYQQLELPSVMGVLEQE